MLYEVRVRVRHVLRFNIGVKCKGSMDPGTDYCYAGVLLALLTHTR